MFGNRVVSAALWGAQPASDASSITDDVAGPESLIHSILALGAAGVHVGDSVFTAFGNDRLASVLSDGPGADPWAPELLALGPAGDPDSSAYAGAGFEGADSVWSDAVDSVLSRRSGGGGRGLGAERAVDAASQAGGRALPGSLRSELEARFGGVDLGRVQIHTDGAAQSAAEAIDAAAYTMGTDIWFGQGQFAPDTERGMHLLAHELTHVLQNMRGDGRGGGGEVIDGVAVSSPSDARELEAEAVAHAVMRGDTPAIASDFGAGLDGELGGDSAGAQANESVQGGLVAERTPDGAKPAAGSTATNETEQKFITLPDGTKTELHKDGKDGYYISGPKGEHLACDAQGNPTSAALDQMAADSRGKGSGVPTPEPPVVAQPGAVEPGAQGTEGKEPAHADVKGAPSVGGSPTVGGGPSGAGPGTYAELAGGSLSKYANEKAWHDSWKQAGSQAQSAGGPGVGDRVGLVGEALLSGGADGFVQGAQAAIIDVVLNKATSKIPYAAGFIAMAQIAYDPKKWWADTVTTGIVGKVGGGWDKLTGEGSDWIDRFEGVVNILEGLNNIIGLASTVCMIVAAAGFILSFICPALIPFVALAAKWGLLLGEINTVVGLGLNLMRLIIVVARSVQIAVSDANPEVQAKRAEKLKEMMTEWTSDFTKRQGNKLAGKLQTKKDGKAGEPGHDGKAAPHGDGSAATQKKGGWKSRLAKIGDEVTGISQMGKEASHIKHNAKDTMKMTKAFGSEKFGSREQLKAMQDVDPNAVSQNSADRLNKKEDAKAQRKATRDRVLGNIDSNKKALAANNEGKGLAGGNTATSEITNGQRGRADIRKRATDPDFWDGASSAERRSMRRHLEKSSNPADVELARQMTQAERRLKEFSTDKDFLPGTKDNAAVRVTQESGLHKRGTVGARGLQGVTKLEDNRGVNSAQEMANDLGMTKKYIGDVKQNGFDKTDWNGNTTKKQDGYVAAIYTPDGALKKSTGKAMAEQLHKNGGGKYGKDVAKIQREITRALNTPLAPSEAARAAEPNVFGSARTQELKRLMEADLGANNQKTADGKTLTEGGHQTYEDKHIATLRAIDAEVKSGKISESEAQSRRDRTQNRADRRRRGDSHDEFYDVQMANGQTNPLAKGGAKKLADYDELPVVKRLDWGEGGANKGTQAAPVEGRRTVSKWFKDEVNVKQGAQDLASGVKSGASETARGFGNRDNLAGNQVEANGYGHQGTGGHVGQGTGPVQTILNSMFSSPAVNEEGGVKLDKEGKPLQVSTLDSVTNTLTGGLAGKDKHGEGGFENAAHHWVQDQEAKLKERLAAFDAQHISVTGELADPPTQNESILDTSANTWKEYDAEIGRLRASAGVTEGLKGDADAEKAALENEKALADGNKGQMAAQKEEIAEKKANQDKADTKIGEQSAKGGELGGATGAVIGVVAGFVTGFMEMCGMIPSRLTSAGTNASKNAQSIKDGVQKTSDSATTTKEQSQQDQATVEGHRQAADTANSDTIACEAQADTLTSSIEAEKANTEAGKQELQAASQDIDSRIDSLEAKKEEEAGRSDAAAEAMGGWADGHVSARTGEEEEGDGELEAIEHQAAEIKKKSEESETEGAPVGDFPEPIQGTVFADLAGPAPVRTPSVDASAFAQGAPLPEAVKSRMGAAFGQDFADVKVHTGEAASDAASGFNARAFAFGSDILFGAGQFNPGSKGGDELIAHELQHVVQQRGAPKGVAPKGLRLGGGFAEIDADRIAATVVDRLHGKNPKDGDVTAPRAGRDPVARQDEPGLPGAGGQSGGTEMSRGRSADGSQGERGGNPGLNISGSINIGGVRVGGSVQAGEHGVTGSAKATGNVAGVPVGAQVSSQGASVSIGQAGSAQSTPGSTAKGHTAGPGQGRGVQGNRVEGSAQRVRGTGETKGGDEPIVGAAKVVGANGAPAGAKAAVGPGGAKKGPAGKAGDEQRADGKDKDKGGLAVGGAANVDKGDAQGGNDERGAGPGETKGASPDSLQPGNPATEALGPAANAVLGAVMGGGGQSLFGGAPAMASLRELPKLAAFTAQLPKDQEQQLQKTTGMTGTQHRQAIEADTDRLRDEVKSLQDDATRYSEEQKGSLRSEMSGKIAEAQGAAAVELGNIAGAFAEARKRVADAVAGAKAQVEAGAMEAQGKLDTALPTGKTALGTAYEAGKKSLGDLKTKWVEPFNTMVVEASKQFGIEANTASGELAAQKTDILKAWPTAGGDALTNAENEARRNAASKGIDQAVTDYKNGGKAKADAVIAQKPQYQASVTGAVTPVEQKLESLRQDGEAKLDAAYASGTAQIATDKTSAVAEIDSAQASSTGSLDSSEKSGKGQVEAASGRLTGDIDNARVGAEGQIDAAVAGLGDRYADWLQGVVDGIPADQPMQKKTAEEYLAGKRQELARFHQTVLDELLGVCDGARTSLDGSIASTLSSIRALGESGAGSAGTVADQQVTAVNAAAGTFAQSMALIGGAIDSTIQQYVTPIPETIAAKVTETDTSLQQKKQDAAADIARQAVAYGAELRAKIKTMVPMLTPMANAAAQGVRPKLVDRAEKVFKACKGAGTDENMLYNGLRGCTALSGIALESSVWPDLHAAEGGMRAFMQDDVDGTEAEIAFGYLAGNTAKSAQLELDNSMHWYGDDEEQIEKVLRDLSPEDLKAMQNQEGWSEVRGRLVDNLGGTDLDVTKALLIGNAARADAYRLRDKINEARADMDPDALHKALEGVDPQQLAAVQQEFHNIQNKVDPEATNVPAIDPAVAAKELGDFSTRHIEGLADVQGSNKNLAEALATKGRESDEAAIHRFEVERGRDGGPEQEGLEKALYANPDLQERLHSPDAQERAKAESEQKAREARIREGYATAYGNGNANAMKDAMGNMYKDDSDGDTRRRMVQNMLADGTNTPRVAADSIYLNAKAKTGTDEAAVKRALAGMRPDEVLATSQTYAAEHGNGDPAAMAKDLGVVERNADGTRKKDGDHSGFGSELSGDDRREVEELMMGDPKYQTPQQKLAHSRLQKDWTVGEESTGVGRWLLSGTNERADLDRNFARVEAAAANMNADGSFKGATPEEQAKNKKAFQLATGDAGVNADDYRAAGDRTAGYVTTGIAVVGAIVITAASFGSGAPAGAALIAAAGAAGTGVASMGANYALKGGRYGWEQATTDLALTAVTTATAGGGAYLGAMNKGVGILANSTKITSEAGKKVVGQMIVGAGSGLINGAATTAATDSTWDKGFSKGMKEVGKGSLKQAAMESVTNGVSTGIDETAWAKAMTNKGLLSGSFAKGTSQGVAGMTSAATGIGIDSARGKYKGDLTDGVGAVALEGAKQFAGGFGGNIAGKSHVEPWAQRHQQGPSTDAPTQRTPGEDITPLADTQTPVADTSVQPRDNATPLADTSVQPRDNATPLADTSVQPPVADTTVQPRTNVEPVVTPTAEPAVHTEGQNQTQNNEGVQVAGNKDGMTAQLPDRTVVSTPEGAISTHADGTQEIRSTDGTLTRLDADGSTKTILPDGTIVLEHASGEKAMLTKDGQYVPLGADGKPVQNGADPTVKQREDALISGLEALIASKKISQEDGLRVIAAGDIDAQQKSLGSLSEHVAKQEQLLNSIIELTKTKGPDGEPLVSKDQVDAAFQEKDPQRALQLVEANAKNQMRDAQTSTEVNALETKSVQGASGEHVQQVFDNITLGAGFAGISNEISQKTAIANGGGSEGQGQGKRLVVGEGNPWLQAKSKLGQKAGESEVPGAKNAMADTSQSSKDAYMQAKEHAENVEINRNASEVGVYQGKYGAVETKPTSAGSEWPAGAEVRVPVTGADGKVRYLYAKRIDLAGGPGSARQLETDGVRKNADGTEHLNQGIISESLYAQLKAEGIIISGDQSFNGGKIGEGDVVINYGAGASGAWGAEGSYKNASEITWLGRQAGETKSRLNTDQRAALETINAGLKSTEPAVRDQAIRDLNSLATDLLHPDVRPSEHLHGLDADQKALLADVRSRLTSEDASVRGQAEADLGKLSADLSKISGPDGLTQNQLERLAGIHEKVHSNDPLVREEGMRQLEEFTFKENAGNGYLPRNKTKGAAFDLDLQSSSPDGKITRAVVPDIHRITYEMNPETGKLMIRVEGKPQHGQTQGEVHWADKMVFSIGQDGTAKGGPGDILQNIDTLVPIVDTSGTVYDFPAVVALQNPEGTIRVLGAAATSPSLGAKITNGAKTDAGQLGGQPMDGAFVRRNQSLQANDDSTPTDSKGVVGSFNHAMKMITAANKDQLIAIASLPAAQQEVLLGNYDQANAYRKAADEEKTANKPL